MRLFCLLSFFVCGCCNCFQDVPPIAQCDKDQNVEKRVTTCTDSQHKSHALKRGRKFCDVEFDQNGNFVRVLYDTYTH